GFYLLWQKGLVPLTARLSSVSLSPARLSLAGHSHGHHHHDHGHQHHDQEHHHHRHDHDHHDHGHHHDHGNGHRHHNHAHDHVHDHNCGCGGHAPDPKMLKQPLDVQSAAAAVLSVGLRPCTGALIVLVFAASQGLFLTGVISTFAMAFGTALTTSTLAVFALTAKTFATRYLSGGASAGFVFKSIEIAGAGLLIFFGGTLFAASMMA
ncbi:MAG: nickel transporter, partial [Pseudomonadota bacterium]